MAGLVVAGALLLQPKMASFLDKLKTRSGEASQTQHSEGGGLTRKKTTTFGGIFRGKAAPAIDPSDVLRPLVLLLIARGLKDQVKENARNVGTSSSQIDHGRSSYDQPPPVAAELDESLPEYSRRDPNKVAASGSHAPCQDVNLLWKSLLCQAVIRLELFCIEVLPIASELVNKGNASRRTTEDFGSAGPSRSSAPLARLPESLLPPPDVCMAWAATVTGPGWSQLAISHHPLSVLADWEFPLSQIAACYALEDGVPNLRGPEKVETFWTQTTGTPFQPGHANEEERDGDVLARGLRVYCPSPSCSFSAYVPILGQTNGRHRVDSEVNGDGSDPNVPTHTGRSSPTRHSQRGLAERCWRRKCQDCGQTTDLDTLIGRKFLEDVRAWCEASGRFGASHFEGLLVDEETGEQDSLAADVWASQILSPLFSPALSQERQRRIDALKADGTLGNGTSTGHKGSSTNSNSLGAAMRNAAVATFATTPYALGEACSWSFDSIAEWIAEHTLTVNPMPALAGSLGAGLPNEHPYPDQMGGGFSAGGIDFTAENPYEEESTKPAQVQAQEKRERLLTFVNRLLDPYRRLKEDGIPSVEHTIDSASSGDAANRWTNVLLGLRRPVSEMLTLTRELDQWAQDGDIVQNGSGSTNGTKAGMQVPQAICSLYTETLLHLRSSRSRSRTTLKREPLELKTCRQLLRGADTPAEIRLGRLAHELSRSGGGHKNSAPSYEEVMRAHLGIVPRGLLDEAR